VGNRSIIIRVDNHTGSIISGGSHYSDSRYSDIFPLPLGLGLGLGLDGSVRLRDNALISLTSRG
jgi:hypothetical protein